MKKVITYGTYDLFHQGHYNLLKRAKELGDYLIVGVTTDNFDLERGKMNTCNNVMERIEAVKSTGLADQIVIEDRYHRLAAGHLFPGGGGNRPETAGL